jgi:type I restriction enzyme S subunit
MLVAPDLKPTSALSHTAPGALLLDQQSVLELIQDLTMRVEEIESLQSSAASDIAYLGRALLAQLEQSIAWKYQTVGELILDSQNGRSLSESKQDGNGRVLTLTAVRDVRLNTSCSKSVKMDDSVARQFRFYKGDIFVSRSNTRDLVGLSAVATEDSPPNLIYPDLLIRLVVDRGKVIPDYLAYALRFPSVRRQIQERAQGTSQSMVKISGASLRTVLVPIPSSLEEQQVILAHSRRTGES